MWPWTVKGVEKSKVSNLEHGLPNDLKGEKVVWFWRLGLGKTRAKKLKCQKFKNQLGGKV